ncbi:MAG: GGDEF domain-containing protein [Halieaceae bacterium]
MEEIYVKNLMSRKPCFMPCEASLGEVAATMVERTNSCMVIGHENHPEGIITERDLVRILVSSQQELGMLDRPVGEFMSAPILTVNQDESLYDAVVVARTERVRHLPVVDDDDCMVGIVTDRDLANAHFHVVEVQTELIEKSIAKETRDLLKANHELQTLSMEDHLLGIGNRRAMEVDLAHTHSAYLRYNRPYCVVLIDVDYFKNYNDHYGHSGGDQALQIISGFIKDTIRDADRVYRYGGEELLVLLPEIDAQGGLLCGERLVEGLAAGKLPHDASPLKLLTISAGIAAASVEQESPTWEELVNVADQALYRAKSAGRNRALLEQHSAVADVADPKVTSIR